MEYESLKMFSENKWTSIELHSFKRWNRYFASLIIIINTAAYSFVCNWQVTRIDDALAEYIDEDRQETKTNFPDAGHVARAQTVYRNSSNCNLVSSNQLCG